jgi:hypothetical protein
VFDAALTTLRRSLSAAQEPNELPEWKTAVAAAREALRAFEFT